MGKYLDYVNNKKKKEEGLTSSSSNSSRFGTGKYGRYQAEKTVGLSTLDADLKLLGDEINKAYSDWQDPYSLKKTKTSVEQMRNRIDAYKEYGATFGVTPAFDTEELSSGYQKVLDDLDKLSNMYGHYQNADAFNSAMKKAELSDKFSGLTYEEVQAEKSKYAEDSDEYDFLSKYSDYSDLTSYDKALNDLNASSRKRGGDSDYRRHGGDSVRSDAEADALKRELQEARNVYALDHKFDLHKDVMNRDDFAEKSQYVPNGGGEAYEYINDVNGARAKIKAEALQSTYNAFNDNGLLYSGDGMTDYEKKGYDYLYPEEKAVYNAYVSIDKEEGTDKARQFLEDMEITLTKRKYEAETKGWQESADSGAGASIAMSAISVPANLVGSVQGAIGTIADMAQGKEYNPYSYYMSGLNFASYTRKYVSENIAEETKGAELLGQNVPSFLYQTGMSMADSLASMAVAKRGAPFLLGASSALQKAKELKEAGASDDEILKGAMGAGAFEIAFEKIGIDNLFKAKNADSIAKVFKETFKQAGIEGFEEAGTEFANILWDDINRGENSESYKKYQDYIERGFSSEEAKNMLASELANQVMWAGIGGAISGTGFGGVHSVANYSKNRQYIDAERDIIAMAQMTPEEVEALDAYESMVRDVNSEAETVNDTDAVNAEGNMAELQAIAEGMDKTKADLLLAQYDGKTDVESYVNSFNLAYFYGEKGYTQNRMLQMKGVLTPKQVGAIYKATVFEGAERRENAIKAINEKHGKGVTVAGTFDDSIINYENTDVEGKIRWDSLTETQRKAVRFAQGFSKVTGANIAFTDKGAEEGFNGKYDADTNTITLDIYAGMDKIGGKTYADSIIPTLSHEITHWMKAKSPAMYQKMREFVLDNMQEISHLNMVAIVNAEMNRIKERHPDIEVTEEYAMDELVARACEDMLSNSNKIRKLLNSLSDSEQKTFIGKIKGTFKNLMDWANDLLAQYKSGSAEARFLREYKDKLKKLSKMWDKALEGSIQANQSLQKEGKTGEQIALENGIADNGETIVGRNFIQLSERTYEKGGRDFLENWIDTRKGMSKAEKAELKKQVLDQMDAMYDMMQAIKKDYDLPDYTNWSNVEAVLDERGLPELSVIVSNGDYKMNIDFSQVCKKRRALNAVLNALIKSGDLNFYTLTETDIDALNAIIKKHDLEIACALCFVDSKRYRVGAWADSFCEGSNDGDVHKYGFNEMIRSLVPKGSDIVIDEYNFTGRDIDVPSGRLLKNVPDSELDFSLIDSIMEKSGKRTAQYRYAKAIKESKNLRSILNSAEIIASEGLDAIRLENKDLYALINGHQGTAKPKFAHNTVAYANDILRANWTAVKAKMVGGVRVQSFSDFMANMVFDYVQMISEMELKQLPAHAYTKEAIFVKMFGLTGMKINMSLVPKAVELTDEQIARFGKLTAEEKKTDAEWLALKETAGLKTNPDGTTEYIWEDETFPFDVAIEIMEDERYAKNCGTIAVGVSDKHILKLLDDDRISMVIPYHKSGLNHMIAVRRMIDLYNDYTDVQNTRRKHDGKKLDKDAGEYDFDFYGDLYGTDKKEGTNDILKTVENYKTWCEENGYLPKFDKFKDHSNYYKLLVDFRVFDKNGEYAPQEQVRSIYPEDMQTLASEGYVARDGNRYGGLLDSQETTDKLDRELEPILDEFRAYLKSQTQFSDREVEQLTEDDYKKIEKHFGTTGNFNVAGYMLQNGKLLDFSGKHWGDTTSRSRQVDHRDIQEVITDDNNGFDSMVRMISNGNIRLMPESGGINLAVAPTKNQRTVLRRYIEFFKGNIVVDIDAVGGDTVKSFTYEAGTSTDRILGDIDRYFKGGTQSELMSFHTQYSDRDYMDAVNRGDMKTAQKMVDEKALELGARVFPNGKLINYYHGTPNAFTSFDIEKARQGTHGFGFYFSPMKVKADGYKGEDGRLISAYIFTDKLATMANHNLNASDVEDVLNKFKVPADEQEWLWHGYDSLAEWLKDESDRVVLQEIEKRIYSNSDASVDEILNTFVTTFGYDGIQAGNETILFDNKLVKLADAVTYDDEGNVIPLSKRFNAESDDIRYSDREIDSWLKGLSIDELISDLIIEDIDSNESTVIPRSKRAKRRVDEVNKRLKQIGLSFNGTKSLAWTDERIDKYLGGGYYGSSNPNYAQAYITYITPQQFLNLTVGGKNETLDMIERESESYGEVDFEKLGESAPLFLSIEEGKNGAKVTGHEGRHRMYLLGKAGFGEIPVLLFDYRTKYNKTAKEELKLTAQRYNYTDLISKSRNVVVNDVIPFSQGNRDLIVEKFGSGNNADIHFSDRDNTSVYDTMGEIDRLVDENRMLKEDIASLKNAIGTDDVDIRRFKSLADYLKKMTGSQYSRDTLGTELKSLYNFIQTAENLQWTDVVAQTYDIASRIMNPMKDVPINYFKNVMADIRNDKVSLSEEQRAEAEAMFDGYGNFHKHMFGRANITAKGVSLEEAWAKWASKYPTVFDASIKGIDQVKALVEIVDALKETSNMMGEYEREEAIRHLSTEVYNQMWNIASDKSETVKKAKADHRKMMEKMREDYEARQKEKTLHPVGEVALKYEKILKKTIERDRRMISKAKEKGRENMNEYRDRVARNAKIASITKKSLTLNQWLTKNSKDEHIPEVMKAPVAYLLNAIDFSSKQLLGMRGGDKAGTETRKDISLSKALEQVHDMVNKINSAQIGEAEITEIYGTFADFPAGFADDIRELSSKVNDTMRTVGDNAYILNKMSLEELEALDKIVTTIKTTVTKMNKFLAIRHAESVASLSTQSMNYMDSLGKGKVFDGIIGKADKTLAWGNALPYYVFKRFGEGGMKVYEALQDGWDKFAFHTKKIIDYANDTYTVKEVKEWAQDVKMFDVLEPATDEEKVSDDYEPKYQKVQMSVPQIMSLYCLQKREQAKGHLMGGGIRVADIKTKKGIVSQSDGIMLTESELYTIINTLTARQREVADKLQAFMNNECTEWGNEVSMLRFGYKAFGEDNYFPIQSYKNNLAVNDETQQNNSLFRLLNMSFTKSTIKNANNRVVISDIFDVFAQHASDMAKYNALALPVLDAFKWYNYKSKIKKGDTQFDTKSLKQSLENAFGKEGQNYFVTFLRDINGEKNVGRDTLSNGFFTNAKIASVGFNLKVVALQPTSYLRAQAVIEPKYLAKAMAHKPKTDMAEKYCGIALWKSLGFYDINVQRSITDLIKHDESWKDNVAEWSMKGAEIADKVTWGYLWNACEAEVKDKHGSLKVGSDEFYQAVGKRLREVIYATQVVDSTMTRSQMMRSSDMGDKILTAFASEPTLSYNMVQDCYFDWRLTQRQTGSAKTAFAKHGKKLARVAYAYTITNAITALVELGFEVFRDDEEDRDEKEIVKMFLENFGLNMSISNKIPYVKELISILQGFTSSRMDTQWMQYFSYTLNGVIKLMNGEGNVYTTAKNGFKALSYVFGIPIYNAIRDVTALLDKAQIADVEEWFNETIGGIYPSTKTK